MLKSIDPRWRRMVAIDHRRGHHRLFFSLEGHVAGCCRANSFAIILIYAPVSSRRRHAVGRLGLHVPAPEISSLHGALYAPLLPIISPCFDGFRSVIAARFGERVALEHARGSRDGPAFVPRRVLRPGDTRLCALIDFPDDPTVTVSRPRF